MPPRWLKALGHVDRCREVIRCAVRFRNWIGVCRRYLGLGGRFPFRVRTRCGLSFELRDIHDLTTAWVIFCRSEYRVPVDVRTILDLGANIGLFALYAVRVAPAANVVAVEPFPATYERLVENVKTNGMVDRVTCLRVAAGATPGLRKMEEAGPSQSRGLAAISIEGGVTVEAITITDLIARATAAIGGPIDFLKIDIEGAEHECFGTIPLGGLGSVRTIGMEYHPNGDKDTLFAMIVQHGFRCASDRQFGPHVGVAHFDRTDA